MATWISGEDDSAVLTELELILEVFSSLSDSVKCFLVYSRGFTADAGNFRVPFTEVGEVKDTLALRRG